MILLRRSIYLQYLSGWDWLVYERRANQEFLGTPSSDWLAFRPNLCSKFPFKLTVWPAVERIRHIRIRGWKSGSGGGRAPEHHAGRRRKPHGAGRREVDRPREAAQGLPPSSPPSLSPSLSLPPSLSPSFPPDHPLFLPASQ